MTAERFGELLRRPLLLSGQNATELEELIAEYPWCGPLRILRYQKAVLEGDTGNMIYWRSRAEPFLSPGADLSELDAAADRNPARAELHFGFGADSQANSVSEVERHDADFDPASVDEIEAPEVESPEIEVTENAAETSGPTATFMLGQPTESWSATGTKDFGGPEVDELVAAAASAVGVAEWYLQRNGLIMEYGRPQPAPIETLRSYREWRHRRAEVSWQKLLLLGLEGPPSGKTRKPKRSADPAEPEVASETLADLLASQGHYEKALRMYEQLALRHPTKRDNFAARIQALQHASH